MADLRYRGNAEAASGVLPDAAKVQVLTAIAALQKDTGDEDALGDAASQTRNLVVSDAAWTLRDLAMKHRDISKFAVESGGIQALVSAIRDRPNSEAVQWKATSALGQLVLCEGQASQALVGEVGGVEVVISALRGHPNSEPVQEHGAEALAAIVTGHEENQTRARKGGGVEAVVVSLEHHVGRELLQRWASAALAGLVANSPDSQMRARRANALEVLKRTFQKHAGCLQVEEQACEALRQLVAGSKDNQRLACRSGLVPPVVAALKKHRTSKELQVKALAALSHLVVTCSDAQRQAGEAGAATVLHAALKAFATDDTVQELACEALGHLVANDELNQNLARETALVEAVIQTVLGRNSIPAGLQGQALSTLGLLVAGNTESQGVAGEAGGVEVLADGLRRQSDSEAVRMHAAVALEHFAKCHPENQLLARQEGTIEELITILRQYPNHSAVQKTCSSALQILIAENHTNTRVAVASGGIEEVTSALWRQSRSHQEHQEVAREAGLVEAIVHALEQQKTSAANKPKAPQNKHQEKRMETSSPARLLQVLGELVESNYENQSIAGNAGGVEAIVGVMKACAQKEDIQERAAETLGKLLTDYGVGQRRAKACDASDVLVEAATSENQGLQAAAQQALEALFSGEHFPKRIMETEYGRKHSTASAISDVSMRGITLEQILDLQEVIQDSLRKYDIVDKPPEGATAGRPKSARWEELSMYQVRDHFIMPLTQQGQCSFAELVAQGRQPPMWMISHWWGTPFPYTVRMLQLQARSRQLHNASSVTYWCDAFANNQWDKHPLEGDVLKFPFARAMLGQSCMGTVLLCDPEVTALLRTWCVFEAHITQQLRSGALADRCDKKRYFLDILAPVIEKAEDSPQDLSKVTITMLQDAIGGSWNEVSDTEGVFFPLGVAHVGVGVNVCLAEVSEESDRRTILNFLCQGEASEEPPPAEHPKYDELNSFVHEVFASAELYRIASEQPDSCVEVAKDLLQLRANINSFVRQGQTALFAAAGADPAGGLAGNHNPASQRELLDLLLCARADVNHASADMKTVLDCATGLSEASLGLLVQHGAKSFVDVAPDLERTANQRLTQILATGFASEQQAFIGGDAGTNLGAAAERSVQASASILKLYHWAPCRIGMQTSLGRHQVHLAPERSKSVLQALESAGCKNTFHVHFGAQVPLLTLSLSLAPPDAQYNPSGVGGTSAALKRPRSPQAVLALRNGAGRLPPVNADIRSPANPRPQGFEGRRPWAEPDPILSDNLRIGAGPDPLPSVKAQAWQLSAGNATPSSGAAWAAPNGRGLRQSGTNGFLNINPSSPTVGLLSRGSSGFRPHTPTGLTPRRNPATDLDALAGIRWMQTSITSSKSAPSLHAVNLKAGNSNHGPEVKGLGSTDPFAGLDPGNPRAAGSGSLAARLAPAPPGSSPRRNTLPSIHGTQGEAAGVARIPVTPGNRPQGAVGSRPQVYTGSRQPAPAPPPKTSPSAGKDAGEATADRPPVRSGPRPARLQTGGQDSKGTANGSKVEPESPTAPVSRKASSRPSGRHGSRVSVSDLMD